MIASIPGDIPKTAGGVTGVGEGVGEGLSVGVGVGVGVGVAVGEGVGTAVGDTGILLAPVAKLNTPVAWFITFGSYE
jgi:hypothetical protein